MGGLRVAPVAALAPATQWPARGAACVLTHTHIHTHTHCGGLLHHPSTCGSRTMRKAGPGNHRMHLWQHMHTHAHTHAHTAVACFITQAPVVLAPRARQAQATT